MRIISGKFKGRRIFPPKNLPVRPTTDMSKEALFNVLNNHFSFDSLKVLDLFSGTGNISFEFSSRGVEEIIAVDNNSMCIHFIEKTKGCICTYDVRQRNTIFFRCKVNEHSSKKLIF